VTAHQNGQQCIEQHEHSARRWYGGAKLGLNLQWQPEYRTDFADYTTERLDCRSSLCYCPYDSVPEAEEQETLTKAAAMLEAIHFTKHKFNSLGWKSGLGKSRG